MRPRKGEGAFVVHCSGSLHHFAWIGQRYIKFLMDRRGPFLRLAGPERTRQKSDLADAAANGKSRFPSASAEAYYAIVQQGRATFDAVR
jgi:hypothetical protein